MFIDVVEARRGVQVPVGKVVHTAEFAFRVAGVDGDWDEAQKRATGLGRCNCEDFINRGISSKMPCKHIYALVMSGERFWDCPKSQNTRV